MLCSKKRAYECIRTLFNCLELCFRRTLTQPQQPPTPAAVVVESDDDDTSVESDASTIVDDEIDLSPACRLFSNLQSALAADDSPAAAAATTTITEAVELHNKSAADRSLLLIRTQAGVDLALVKYIQSQLDGTAPFLFGGIDKRYLKAFCKSHHIKQKL